MKKISHFLTVAFTYFFLNQFMYGQCLNQVVHDKETQTVNNVAVTVISEGRATKVDLVGCTDEPMNYRVSGLSDDGSFTFNFLPAIANVSLNLFRIDISQTSIEEVQLFVNGSHYRIPAAGDAFDNCDLVTDTFPAVITSEGNIRANLDLSHGSVKNLVIPGPIHTLKVQGNVVLGSSSGLMFSIFICDGILAQQTFEEKQIPFVVPNPFSSKAEIKLPANNDNWSANLINLHGQTLKTFYSTGEILTIDRDNLAAGMYVLQFNNGKHFFNTKVIVKD